MLPFSSFGESVVGSPFDTDFYKFTSGQFVFAHKELRDVQVKYAFVNRTKGINLARVIDEHRLREELDEVRTLQLDEGHQMNYLRAQGIFSEEYLKFLKKLRLPPYSLEYGKNGFTLTFEGPWAKTIYWEIPALEIVNELYYCGLMKNYSDFDREAVRARGILRLYDKIATLKQFPKITFVEFGTRRRFSRNWQEEVVGAFAEELPTQLLGTSNVHLAINHGLKASGTYPHELQMVMTSLYPETTDGMVAAQNTLLDWWWKQYGYDYSVALPDTYGSDFFYRTAPAWVAELWKANRQDSGDPITEVEKDIAWRTRHGADPTKKLAIPSDGLELPKMISIQNHFDGRIATSFGWGTNATNDLGFDPLSIVIKPVVANGKGLVKLSNNIAKAIGTPEDIARVRALVGYDVKYSETCKY